MSVLCLTIPREVRAEPIRVTGGSLLFTEDGPIPPGSLSLVGTPGFTLEAGLDPSEGRIDPALDCFPVCVAASTISVGGAFTAAALGGTATLDGHTYPVLNDERLNVFAGLFLSGTIDVPAWRNAPVTISAPFKATGFLSTTSFRVPIQGSGRVTLNLVPSPQLEGAWEHGPFRYDFTATSTPEPATLTLVGGSFVASAYRLRRRRNP